ncbi:hypothetical protein [Mixta calida]|uniref:hypothetical protein n=1 Tax=Mixta calida TaxID=665913 RepID=UPI0034D5AD46
MSGNFSEQMGDAVSTILGHAAYELLASYVEIDNKSLRVAILKLQGNEPDLATEMALELLQRVPARFDA